MIKTGKSELNGDNVLWLRVAGSLNAAAKRPISFFISTLFGQLFPIVYLDNFFQTNNLGKFFQTNDLRNFNKWKNIIGSILVRFLTRSIHTCNCLNLMNKAEKDKLQC